MNSFVLLLGQEHRRREMLKSLASRQVCAHVKNNSEGWRLRRMTNRFAQYLKRVVADNELTEQLLNGDLVLQWQGTGAEDVIQIFDHVALHYMSPWRPTFVQMDPLWMDSLWLDSRARTWKR